ncbi:MAG: porin, partial [Porticoccus sp.]|nr:porin [Porticoccus sp.]
IKGAVDLDGGMKAVYKYEMSTDYSTESLRGNRNAYLGLKGGFGQVIAGRHDMPFKTVGRKFDLFGDTIGDNRTVARGKVDGDDYADRRDNVLMYTNKFGAVSVKAAYAPEEAKDDSEDMGLGLGYKEGAIKVMFAYESHGKANLTGGTPVGDQESVGVTIAGSYKMNNMTFLAGYSDVTDLGGDEGDAGQATSYTVGGKLKAGMNTFKLQYTASETDVDKSEAAIVAVGVDHAFSKKTKVYAVYAGIANDDNRDAGFTNSGHDATVAAAAGEDATGFSLGMIHKF